MLVLTRLAIAACLWFCLSAVAAPAQQTSSAGPEPEIRAVLDAQVAAWNKRDLQGFMKGYWLSPELTFYSGDTPTVGWDAALERYRKNYQAGTAEMGKLSFSDLQIETLSPEAAFVRGRYRLVLSSGKQPHGLFTLVFRKFPEGWRIVHDHSSGVAE